MCTQAITTPQGRVLLEENMLAKHTNLNRTHISKFRKKKKLLGVCKNKTDYRKSRGDVSERGE